MAAVMGGQHRAGQAADELVAELKDWYESLQEPEMLPGLCARCAAGRPVDFGAQRVCPVCGLVADAPPPGASQEGPA